MECPVCLTSLQNLVGRRLPCHTTHIFCSKCLREIAKFTKSTIKNQFSCPLCKAIICLGRRGIEALPIVEWEPTLVHSLNNALIKMRNELTDKCIKEDKILKVQIEELISNMDKKKELIKEEIRNIYFKRNLKIFSIKDEIDNLDLKFGDETGERKLKNLFKIRRKLLNFLNMKSNETIQLPFNLDMPKIRLQISQNDLSQ
ncbi:unnamed protein product [Dimorphilus gyrociliatus]|uniref:RING-type domain-containing protein n=1 Tax=Dimorphilus gyrociliatus TaxID=2664684 RepID=A0A7I8VH44_9ANNE|nr:unnamed protein product [Dimorphilus gyrociliatus]